MSKANRLWEIDSLRGKAILMMIVFHFFFDMEYFGAYSAGVQAGFWWLFARATAAIFIFLVGVSLTLSYSRAQKAGTANFSKYLKRGLKIFGYGLLITAMTWLFLKQGFVLFGVLHLIGISIILAYPLLRFRYTNLLLGAAIILTGAYLSTLSFSFPWLLWLGFSPSSLYTLDYLPLLPWFGLVLIGVFLGKTIYPGGAPRLKTVSNPLATSLSFLGRNSLLIYLLHQPILIALLYTFVL